MKKIRKSINEGELRSLAFGVCGALLLIFVTLYRYDTVFKYTDLFGYLYFKVIYEWGLCIFMTFGIPAAFLLYSRINSETREDPVGLSLNFIIGFSILFFIAYIVFPGKHLGSNLREFIQLYPEYGR